MTKFKKLLALILSILMIVSALPLTIGAADADYTIKWKGGYDKGSQGNSTGVLYDGYADIPWYITKSYGGETTIVGEIGQDWGPMLQISSNNVYANYDIKPEFSGLYDFTIETASANANGGTLDIYINGKKSFTYDVESTGDWNANYITGNVGTLALEGGKKTTISFVKTSGTATLRDCVLTLNEMIADETKAVIDLIDVIGEVTLDSEDAIIAAEEAYEALLDVQKQLVFNYDVLTAARDRFEVLKEAEENRAIIEPVVNAIDAIGEVTLDSEAAINEAEALYNALADDKKYLVTNYDVLEAAKERLSELKKEAADREAADAVIELIEAIGEVTEDSELAIVTAENAYDDLTAEQKELVTNLDVLTTARETFNDLIGFVELPDYTIKWMAGYDTGTRGNTTGVLYDGYADIPWHVTKASYDGEEGAWNDIGNDEGDDMVLSNNNHFLHYDVTPEYSGLYKLEVEASSHNSAYEILRSYANGEQIGSLEIQDGSYCSYAKGMREIGFVIADAETPVRISFSNQTSEGSTMVTIRKITLTLLAQPGRKTERAIELIDAIGEVTLDSEDAIIAAENAFNVLTNNEKLLIPNADVLKTARETYDELKIYHDNIEFAEPVMELIDAIGEVTLDSLAAIVAAEEAYAELTDIQKTLVDNYSVLEAARGAYDELKIYHDNIATVAPVIARIDAIGEVTLDSIDAIVAAEEAYAELTDIQKTLVDNYSVLEAARAKYDELKVYNDNKDYFEPVITLIKAIGIVSLDSEEAIVKAEEEYAKLNELQKSYVNNYSVLEAARAKLNRLKEAQESMPVVEPVIDAIKAIGPLSAITLESETLIVAARETYDAFAENNPELVEYVTNYIDLVQAEDRLDVLKNIDSGIIPEGYVLKWKAGHDSGTANTKTGVIADGYENYPYTIINGSSGKVESGHGHIGYDRGYHMEMSSNGHKLRFSVTPKYAGLYQLDVEMGSSGDRIYAYINGDELGYATVNTGSETRFDLVTMGYAYLNAGETYIIDFVNKNDAKNSTTAIRDCVLSAANEYEYEGARIYVRNTDTGEIEYRDIADVVGRSTDAIGLKFTRNMKAEEISKAAVSLTDSEGNPIEFTLAVDTEDLTVLNVLINEALDYGKSYILTHENVSDGFGNVWGKEIINFSTAADDTLSTYTAEVYMEEMKLTDAKYIATGVLWGSKGHTISGRKYIARVKIGDNEWEEIARGNTDADGKFTITYELSEDEAKNSNEYRIAAWDEYTSNVDYLVHFYASTADKESVLGEIQNATSGAEIKNVIEGTTANGTSNADVIGVDLDEINSLKKDDNDNLDSYYDKLVDRDYTDENGDFSTEKLAEAANAAYNIENVVRSKDNAVTELTFDGKADSTAMSFEEAEEFVELIDLDLNKYLFLSGAQKTQFFDKIENFTDEQHATIEKFGEECNKLLEDFVIMEAKKSDLTPSVSGTTQVIAGKVAKVDITLPENAKATDVKGYTITVECGTNAVANDIAMSVASGKVTKQSVAQNATTATFVVEGVNAKELANLGTLEVSSLVAGNIILSIQSGTVDYMIEKEVDAYGEKRKTSYELTDGIIPSATFTLNVVAATTNIKPSVGATVTPGKGTVSGGSLGGGSAPVVTPTIPGAGTETNAGFTDLAGVEWAENSIMTLYKKGIISPAADGKFRPTDNVTRAEFVKMLVTALRITDKTANVKLSDVSQSDWFYSYVAAAVNYGLVLGDEKGSFRPNDAITRQDVCVIISRAMDKLGYAEYNNNTELFYDDGYISDYAKNAVYRMRAHEIVNGVGDGTFAPLSNANRAATAKMIEKFMKEANI